MNLQTIGVIGAGLMGSGIAQVAAQAGYQVILNDVKQDFLDKGVGTIEKNLGREVKKERLSEKEKEDILGRIGTTPDLEKLSQVDLVIEAVFEDMAVKKELYARLESTCPPATIFASNTSGLSITEMASATKRPQQVVGMHFFNPVPVMKLVEVVRGNDTNDETFNLVIELAKQMGKEPIAVAEAPLFAVNRILVPMINEAAFVLQEGIASKEDIDKGMVLGANHPIGPLALADLVGLDTLLMVIDTLHRETGDSKYRACTLMRKLVRAGHYGRKTGKGFYDYQ